MEASAIKTNNANPTVSVILPVYQVIEYVDECIASILAQTFSDFELIIVDDGSTDGTGEKCDAWAEKDGRIAVIHKANAGQSAARNTGIARARGEYLLFVDSDDYIRPSLIGMALERLHESQSDICFFKYELLKPDGSMEPYKEAPLFPQVTCCDASQALIFLFRQQLHHYPWSRIAKTALYSEDPAFFPEGRIMEDVATTARLITRANQVSFLDENLYVYREREGSTISQWSHRLTVDSVAALSDIERDVRSQSDEVKTAAFNYKVKFLFYCLVMECRSGIGQPQSESFSLARKELISSVLSADWKSVGLANRIKYFIVKFGLTRMVAKAKA